jgi:hypothetical protein
VQEKNEPDWPMGLWPHLHLKKRRMAKWFQCKSLPEKDSSVESSPAASQKLFPS